MKAYALKRIDREYEIHLQAYANQSSKAQKKAGKGTKSAYKNFEDFYNYEERINEVLGKKEEKYDIKKDRKVINLVQQANSLNAKGG